MIHKNAKSKSKEAHTSKEKMPFGKYYGQSKRNPVGKVLESDVGITPATKKQTKTPPKKLA